MAFLDKWMLTNVNACHIELFHIQKELTCIRLQGIIETTKAKKEKKDIAFYALWQNWGQKSLGSLTPIMKWEIMKEVIKAACMVPWLINLEGSLHKLQKQWKSLSGCL